MHVYQIAHVSSSQRYIGSTINLEKRWNEHRNDLRTGHHHCAYLQRAWNKYGENHFTFSVIASVSGTVEDLRMTEQNLLDELDQKTLYNTSRTASGGQIITKESPNYDMWRAKIGAANRGKVLSVETKRRMAVSKMGDNNPAKRPEVRDKIRRSLATRDASTYKGGARKGELNHMYGRKQSDATKAKIRQKAVERWYRKQHRNGWTCRAADIEEKT